MPKPKNQLFALVFFLSLPTLAEDTKRKVRIAWSTASEKDAFGYIVYRSTIKNGPFKALHKVPIAGGGTNDELKNYAYIDHTALKQQSYFYYIELITLDNSRSRYSPIFESPSSSKPNIRD